MGDGEFAQRTRTINPKGPKGQGDTEGGNRRRQDHIGSKTSRRYCFSRSRPRSETRIRPTPLSSWRRLPPSARALPRLARISLRRCARREKEGNCGNKSVTSQIDRSLVVFNDILAVALLSLVCPPPDRRSDDLDGERSRGIYIARPNSPHRLLASCSF